MKYKYRRYYFYYLLKTAVIALGAMPLKVNLAVGAFLGKMARLILPHYAKTAEENLTKALGMEAHDAERVSSGMFANLGKNGAEWIAMRTMDSDGLGKLVTEVSGKEKLDRELAKNKGVIVLASHFGNWELIPLYLRTHGYKGAVIARRIYFYKYDKFIEAIRTRFDARVIYRDDSPKHILRTLKDGEMIGMLADQDVDSLDGVFVPFFGKDAFTPTAPVKLAFAADCPLVPVFLIRKSDNTHKLVFEDPIDMTVRSDANEDIKKYTAAWTSVVEKYVREYPDQWVWLHKRWKTKPAEAI